MGSTFQLEGVSVTVTMDLCKAVGGGPGTETTARVEALRTSAFPPGNNRKETENAVSASSRKVPTNS